VIREGSFGRSHLLLQPCQRRHVTVLDHGDPREVECGLEPSVAWHHTPAHDQKPLYLHVRDLRSCIETRGPDRGRAEQPIMDVVQDVTHDAQLDPSYTVHDR
jgi:hypothetical protein